MLEVVNQTSLLIHPWLHAINSTARFFLAHRTHPGLWCIYSSNNWTHFTVYLKKYAHGFAVLCFVVVMQSFLMNSHEAFIHIHQGCFAGTGAIVRLPRCQWSKSDGYGKISQCITTRKHSKAKTVCIFLGIYCTYGYGLSTVRCKLLTQAMLLYFWLHTSKRFEIECNFVSLIFYSICSALSVLIHIFIDKLAAVRGCILSVQLTQSFGQDQAVLMDKILD